MRIALFHNVPSGGAKRAIQEWTIRLAANHELDVFTMSTADHEFCDVRPYVNHHEIFDFHPRSLFTSPFGRFNQLQRWRDLGDLIKLNNQIGEKINSKAYDLLFAHTCQFTFIPALLQFTQKPAIYILHEPFGRGFIRQFSRPYFRKNKRLDALDRFDPLIKLYNKRLDYIQRQSIQHTKLLLANSNFTREHMKVAFNIDTPVYYHGVDHEKFIPIPSITKADFVLSVGELSPRKGFDFIVESLGQIPPDKRPKLKIACNMINPLEKDYIDYLAVKCGVDLQVLSNLTANELVTLYNQARLCIYAPVQEPFGIVPLEAMACGIPVVGVREGGVQESIVHEQTGLLIDRDPKLFAEAIQSLLINPELVAEYGRFAREHVLQHWSWEKSTENLAHYLAECAAGHEPSTSPVGSAS